MRTWEWLYDYSAKLGVPTLEEESELSERIQAGDISARNELVVRNLRLMEPHIKKYRHNSPISAEDAMSEAVFGLVRAAEKFNPEFGKFSTYAKAWLRSTSDRASVVNGPVVRPIYRVRAWMYRIYKILDELEETGKFPHEDLLAEKIKEYGIPGETQGVIDSMKLYARGGMLSLDHPIRTQEGTIGTGLIETLTSGEEKFSDVIDMKIEVDQLMEMCSDILNEKELKVLHLRFWEDRTLEECGKIIGRTRERARQIQENALEKIRKRARRRGAA